MAQFQYRAADGDGKVVEGTIEAPEVVVAVVEENDSDAKIIEFPGAEEASEG